MKFYDVTSDDALKELNSTRDGLSNDEVNNRLVKYGNNVLEEAKGKSKLRKFLDQFNDMMIIILLIVDVVMFIYGIVYSHDYSDSIVITIVVLINAIMGYIQEEKAEVTLEGLKKYTAVNCKVRRDKIVKTVDSKLLVPGDILLLEAGDKVPADGRIIFASNALVDESPLTGESVPVKKYDKKLGDNLQIQDRFNMVFSGCSVTNGVLEILVTATGMNTEIGSIATSLNTPYEVETPLQKKIKEISKKLTIIIMFILLFIFVYGLVTGMEVLEIIMLCVSLAVAAIPEGLPAVITITLSGGAAALARKKTIVRQMNAVETLGSTDIICSDKTGTITQNKMTVLETLEYDKEMFAYICALANETLMDEDGTLKGDPTETCLFDYLIKNNNDPFKIKENCKRLLEAPFDSDRKMMSSVNEIDGKIYCLVKGSLDNLLGRCDYVVKDGKKVKINEESKQEILAKEKEYGNKALRVISFAYKEIENIPSTSEKLLDEENHLIFVGLAGMIDPPRVDVKEAVENCKKAGIRPIMITGDSLITACAIARNVGILTKDSEGVLGSELDKYTDEELVDVVKKYNVYARVSPEHKSRIVHAWQTNGKVVAMTGDGVNDAPAIKDAHVGVGMGITGTEVTKSVADILLLDDSFSTIVVAVSEGRRIFNNIRNNVVYSLSSNFAEIFVVLIAMFTKVSILTPLMILFIDLITDSIPSICLAFEGAEKDIMDKNPRGIDKPLFTPFVNANIAFSAIIETIFVLAIFFIVSRHHTVEEASTLALLSMVMQEIVYSVNCRNLKEFVYKMGLFSNKTLNIGLFGLILLEAIFFLTPAGSLIGLVTVDITLLLKVVAFNLLGFIIYEVEKPLFRKIFED